MVWLGWLCACLCQPTPAHPRARNPCRGVCVCVGVVVVVRGVCCVVSLYTQHARLAKPARRYVGMLLCSFSFAASFACSLFCSFQYKLSSFVLCLHISYCLCCYLRLANVFHSIFISKIHFFSQHSGTNLGPTCPARHKYTCKHTMLSLSLSQSFISFLSPSFHSVYQCLGLCSPYLSYTSTDTHTHTHTRQGPFPLVLSVCNHFSFVIFTHLTNVYDVKLSFVFLPAPVEFLKGLCVLSPPKTITSHKSRSCFCGSVLPPLFRTQPTASTHRFPTHTSSRPRKENKAQSIPSPPSPKIPVPTRGQSHPLTPPHDAGVRKAVHNVHPDPQKPPKHEYG